MSSSRAAVICNGLRGAGRLLPSLWCDLAALWASLQGADNWYWHKVWKTCSQIIGMEGDPLSSSLFLLLLLVCFLMVKSQKCSWKETKCIHLFHIWSLTEQNNFINKKQQTNMGRSDNLDSSAVQKPSVSLNSRVCSGRTNTHFSLFFCCAFLGLLHTDLIIGDCGQWEQETRDRTQVHYSHHTLPCLPLPLLQRLRLVESSFLKIKSDFFGLDVQRCRHRWTCEPLHRGAVLFALVPPVSCLKCRIISWFWPKKSLGPFCSEQSSFIFSRFV